MTFATLLRDAIVLAAFPVLVLAQTTPLTGRHTELPRWCGKPYMSGSGENSNDMLTEYLLMKRSSPNYSPGGMLHPPSPQPSTLLDLRVHPRHSIYVEGEGTGEFIVDAALSQTHGQLYTNATSYGSGFDTLYFDIRLESNDRLLVSSNTLINTTGSLYQVDLTKLKPRMKAYPIVLYGGPSHGNQSFTATSELYYLPAKTTGSMVKIDNLYGGMLFANNVSSFAFQPLLPFGFYTSCSGYLNYSLANVSAYKALGFTGVNPVCAFTDGDLGFLFDWLDEANLPYQYDMRGSYYNLSSLQEQVALVKDRSSLLSWYTADEPDGWQYAFNSTTASYKLLKQLDPYHPTGLVLNCENYFFDKYTVGTDYIMEDAYPVGINATYSIPWDTNCNETYGDCGCDNCKGELQDVGNRLDTFYEYQEWLGRTQKPLWAVNQAFSGEGYWARDPTQAEAWAMNLAAFNHRAKAIMSWTFPSSASLEQAHSQMARVVTQPAVSNFFLGGQPTSISVPGHSLLDIGCWVQGDQVMLGIVNFDYSDNKKSISIPLPGNSSKIMRQPWGNVTWTVDGQQLVAHGLRGLATSILILS